MYIPKHFCVNDLEQVYSFIEVHGFGQLISQVDGRMSSSHIPFLLSECRTKLFCHLAIQNPQASTIEGQEVLVSLQGAHGYISPSWYSSPGVPTWNYQAVHLYGHCRTMTDSDELAAVVAALTNKYESEFIEPWQPDYNESLLGAIVGFEITICDIQCKYKLSQNRSLADRENLVKQLDAAGSSQLAQAMRDELMLGTTGKGN